MRPDGQQDEQRSTGGVGWLGVAGGVAAVGVLGTLGYAIGRRLGWWGASKFANGDGGGVVVDDTPTPTPPKPSSSSGGRSNPPNYSGDANGYDSELFPNFLAVRTVLRQLGYSVPISSDTLQGDAQLGKFQADWNAVTKAIAAGRWKKPAKSEWRAEPQWSDRLRGTLDVDRVPGKHSLNAIGIAAGWSINSPLLWEEIVQQVR